MSNMLKGMGAGDGRFHDFNSRGRKVVFGP